MKKNWAIGNRAMAAALSIGFIAAAGAGGQEEAIVPLRAVPVGKAPHMQVKVVKDTADEKVYVVIFLKGDEVLSGAGGPVIDWISLISEAGEQLSAARCAPFIASFAMSGRAMHSRSPA
jgi:hypothetical protein